MPGVQTILPLCWTMLTIKIKVGSINEIDVREPSKIFGIKNKDF